MCLRNNLPSQCNCGHSFSNNHALSCPTGGFPSDTMKSETSASLLSEVCHGVSIEPYLQPLTGETMALCSANMDNNSRLEIAAYGFWGSHFERVFSDVRVFNPCAQLNSRHEQGRESNMTKGSERLNTRLLNHWFYQLVAG